MKDYVICVCFAMLFCTAVRLVLPDKKYIGIIRIVCGIFVVSNIVSPIVRISSFDMPALDFEAFLSDDGSFSQMVDRAKSDFEMQLTDPSSAVTEEYLSRELSRVFGGDITAKKHNGRWILNGAPPGTEQTICDYVSANYGVKAQFD